MEKILTSKAEIYEFDRHYIEFHPYYEDQNEQDKAREENEIIRIFEEATRWLKEHPNFVLHDVTYFCDGAMFLGLYGQFK